MKWINKMRQFPAFVSILGILAFTTVAQTNLTVENGSKNGGNRGRQLAHVWANPNPPNMVFDRWTGSTNLVQDVFASHTLVNPLGKNINLTATYKSAPDWTLTSGTINGTSVLYHIPPQHIGIIFIFHGAGGSNLIILRPEDRNFANEAVAAGYGVIALNSSDRTTATWSFAFPPNNPDVTNVETLVTQFRQQGIIAQNAPLFAVGTSNGGFFTGIVSHFLNFRAAAIYIVFTADLINNITVVPTIYCVAANDDAPEVGQAGNQRAYNQFLNLRSRGIRTSFNNLLPSPVYPERFWRIPDLTQTDSINIHNALKSNGFLDRQDYLIQNPSSSSWQTVIPPQYASRLTAISDQLDVCFATHKFYSDYNSRVLRFFTETN